MTKRSEAPAVRLDPRRHHDRHRTHLQQLRQSAGLQPRQARRHDHPADGSMLQHMEDLAHRVGARRRDGFDVVRVHADAAHHLIEVDQPGHRHIDVFGDGEFVQRRRRAAVEGEQQGDGPIVGGEHAETTFTVGARRIDEDQGSGHNHGFIHACRVRDKVSPFLRPDEQSVRRSGRVDRVMAAACGECLRWAVAFGGAIGVGDGEGAVG